MGAKSQLVEELTETEGGVLSLLPSDGSLMPNHEIWEGLSVSAFRIWPVIKNLVQRGFLVEGQVRQGSSYYPAVRLTKRGGILAQQVERRLPWSGG
jgi:hypothetical protein